MGKIKEVALAKLQSDPYLLKIRTINSHVVSKYQQNIKQGATFPALVVNSATDYVISGHHTLAAYKAVFDDSVKVPVMYQLFPTKADILRFFVKANITHGYSLDGFTKRKLTLAMVDEGITELEVAELFGVHESRVTKYGDEFVVVPGKSGELEKEPIKNGLTPGIQVTRKQYEEHVKKDLGIPAKSIAGQLVRWLRNGWINFEDDQVCEVLQDLYYELGASCLRHRITSKETFKKKE